MRLSLCVWVGIAASFGCGGEAVDGVSVYWQQWPSAQSPIGLYSEALDGGTPTLLTQFPNPPDGGAGGGVELIGLDATGVLFSPDVVGGAISRIDKTGGNATVVSPGTSMDNLLYVDDKGVYVTTSYTIDAGVQTTQMERIPVLGGPTK